MRYIKVQKLTQESFAKFGEVLTIEGKQAGGNPDTHLWFPKMAVVEGTTSVNLMKVLPHDFIIKDFEKHNHTIENLIPIDGDLIVALSTAGELKEDNIEVFYIPCGKGISVNQEVWHAVPFAVGKEVMSTVIFKNNTSNEDIYFDSIKEEIGLSLS